MHEYLIALGANLGDREYYIEQARDAIRTSCGSVLLMSQLHATVAIGAADQEFLNGALICASKLEPQQVLDQLLAIETKLGRVRTERWGNRTIDLDIILWKNTNGDFPSIRTSTLSIPHPEMHRRGFVLIPAAEIAATWVHFQFNITVANMLHNLAEQQSND